MYACGEGYSQYIAHAPWASSGSASWVLQNEGNHPGDTNIASHASVLSVADSIQEGMTTLMLTDLPYDLLLADLMDEMALLGFHHSYDYIFYPKERRCNFRGYCFVNFVSTAEARRFAEVFVDHKFELVPSPKLSNVQLSRTQGLQDNMAKLKPGTARHDNFYIDLARLHHIRERNALAGNERWNGGYAAAERSRPENEIHERVDNERWSGGYAATERSRPESELYELVGNERWCGEYAAAERSRPERDIYEPYDSRSSLAAELHCRARQA
eukprot:TRINITY_DN3065_c1_g1_i1.p1 TRINITY_DN3065_c1_g1~~TRINITY_DN3065_c1_g1_i1.p1  ORF type:complete len:293 (-),score=23.49 TRINITY_DN3065_c1_g1_i1:74-886(-)